MGYMLQPIHASNQHAFFTLAFLQILGNALHETMVGTGECTILLEVDVAISVNVDLCYGSLNLIGGGAAKSVQCVGEIH